jgi:hypothetical protein
MSFATSSVIINAAAGVDVSTATRTFLLANALFRPIERAREVAVTVRATVAIHPLHLEDIFRRNILAYLDLIN